MMESVILFQQELSDVLISTSKEMRQVIFQEDLQPFPSSYQTFF